MTKLDLTVKVMLNQIEAGEDREKVIKDGMKSYAADTLNLAQFLREKNVDQDAAREIMEQNGIDYSGKTKRFS